MRAAATGGPLFVEAFVEGVRALTDAGIDIPNDDMINAILAKHNTGYLVQGDALVTTGRDANFIDTSAVPMSLDEQGQRLVLESFALSSRMFEEGRHRQGIQELLWLLETVVTAFRGIETGEQTLRGKYFNEIVRGLREARRGTLIDQALGWMTTMHGYLSAPSGGGIRHGLDLKDGVIMTDNDALLIANLVRSYIQYLIAEHQKLSTP